MLIDSIQRSPFLDRVMHFDVIGINSEPQTRTCRDFYHAVLTGKWFSFAFDRDKIAVGIPGGKKLEFVEGTGIEASGYEV